MMRPSRNHAGSSPSSRFEPINRCQSKGRNWRIADPGILPAHSQKQGSKCQISTTSFRDRLRDAGLSVSATRRTLSVLHTMLEFGRGQDLISTNPVVSVRVIGRRDEGAKKILPPSKEMTRTLLAMADRDFRVVILFSISTGVRAGELHAVRWRHLELNKGEVHICTRVDRWGNEDGQGAKTAAGNRTIPLSQTLLAELRLWRLRTRFAEDDHLVFPSRNGTYRCHDNMIHNNWLPLIKKLLDDYQLDPTILPQRPAYVNWHSLRHFAISTWIEAGLAPKTIQTFAGHSSLQITMDRYGHMFPAEGHREAMEKIARELG
jgi:integrase